MYCLQRGFWFLIYTTGIQTGGAHPRGLCNCISKYMLAWSCQFWSLELVVNSWYHHSLCHHLSLSKTSSLGSHASYNYNGQQGSLVQLYTTQIFIISSVYTTNTKSFVTFFMRVDILIIPHCLWSESKQKPV